MVAGTGAEYGKVHQTLWARHGAARIHPCRRCGEPAHEWAYTATDPKERKAPGQGWYSNSIRHYVPLCKPCHRVFDLAVKVARRTEGWYICPVCRTGAPIKKCRCPVEPSRLRLLAAEMLRVGSVADG